MLLTYKNILNNNCCHMQFRLVLSIFDRLYWLTIKWLPRSNDSDNNRVKPNGITISSKEPLKKWSMAIDNGSHVHCTSVKLSSMVSYWFGLLCDTNKTMVLNAGPSVSSVARDIRLHVTHWIIYGRLRTVIRNKTDWSRKFTHIIKAVSDGSRKRRKRTRVYVYITVLNIFFFIF